MRCGRAPERILAAHPPNQLPNLFGHRWTPGSGHDELSTSRRVESPCSAKPMTVSGLTMRKEDRQSLQASHNHAHRSRSADVSLGRFTERPSTASWCRWARFSTWRVVRDLKVVAVATNNK